MLYVAGICDCVYDEVVRDGTADVVGGRSTLRAIATRRGVTDGVEVDAFAAGSIRAGPCDVGVSDVISVDALAVVVVANGLAARVKLGSGSGVAFKVPILGPPAIAAGVRTAGFVLGCGFSFAFEL